jgi:acetate kinase
LVSIDEAVLPSAVGAVPTQPRLSRRRRFPSAGIPNFVCLDTYLRRRVPEVVTRRPILEEYAAMGVRHYAAHGLSYESIAYQLEPNVPQKLIVAHLGNVASIAAKLNGHGLNTSMGLTPLGGIVSGSRSGDIYPGVLPFILRKIAKTAKRRIPSRRLVGGRRQQEIWPPGCE